MRICHLDGFPMLLDVEIVRACEQGGWPAVTLYRCANGHSFREWPDQPERKPLPGKQKPCAACGEPMPGGTAKYHKGECTRMAHVLGHRWREHHPEESFVLEAQPWYRGPGYVPPPLESLDPLKGQMPAAWLDGWAAIHFTLKETA